MDKNHKTSAKSDYSPSSGVITSGGKLDHVNSEETGGLHPVGEPSVGSVSSQSTKLATVGESESDELDDPIVLEQQRPYNNLEHSNLIDTISLGINENAAMNPTLNAE